MKKLLVATMVATMGFGALSYAEPNGPGVTVCVNCGGGLHCGTCAFGWQEKGCRGPNHDEAYVLCAKPPALGGTVGDGINHLGGEIAKVFGW